MFSGIIQEICSVFPKSTYRIAIPMRGKKDKLGDSIAINGVCLTVAGVKKNGKIINLLFDLSQETLNKTTLKNFRKGQLVNVERALRVTDALGGHIVQGHVDAVGRITKIQMKGEDRIFWFRAPKPLMKYIVPKGSIAIDGISLTVVKVKKNEFSVALIPFTLEKTNLGKSRVGDQVNLEADVLAKYISKYLKNK